MADILTAKQRSALMARIRSAGNASTELRLVVLLRAAGITGWRRGCRLRLRGQSPVTSGRLPVIGDQWAVVGGRAEGRGLKHRATVDRRREESPTTGHRLPVTGITVKPDFVFRKARLVVFVDGCFWHGCPRHYTRPKSRRAFWDAKIAANKARDRRIDRALRGAGWRVLHIWEHALKPERLGHTLARLRTALRACGK